MTDAEKAYALRLAAALNAAAEMLVDDIDSGTASYAQIERVLGSLTITLGGIIAKSQGRRPCGNQ